MPSGLKRYEIDVLSTGPFALTFARSIAPLTHSLAPHCSLRSFFLSLAHSLQSSWESGFCLQNERFDFISFEPTVERSKGQVGAFVRWIIGPVVDATDEPLFSLTSCLIP